MSRESTDPSDLIVKVDFDWTLHDTTAFSNDFWAALARSSGRTVESVQKDGNGFHADPELGGYSYDDHIAAYGLDPANLWHDLEQLVSTKNYLYDDSRSFIRELVADGYEPHILSFGETRFQTIKIAPYLGRLVAGTGRYGTSDYVLPVDIISTRKNMFLAAYYAGRRGVLIDDVPNQQLPAGFTEIHLNRAADISEPQVIPGGFRVSTLTQALEVIRTL